MEKNSNGVCVCMDGKIRYARLLAYINSKIIIIIITLKKKGALHELKLGKNTQKSNNGTGTLNFHLTTNNCLNIIILVHGCVKECYV